MGLTLAAQEASYLGALKGEMDGVCGEAEVKYIEPLTCHRLCIVHHMRSRVAWELVSTLG